MREQMLALILMPPFFSIVLTLYMRSVLLNFIRQVPCIENERHIDLFKQTVRVAMLGALAQLFMMFIPIVTYIYGLTEDILTVQESLYVVGPVGLYLIVSVPYKRLEVRAQKIRIDNHSLLPEYIPVKEAWLRRSLPIW